MAPLSPEVKQKLLVESKEAALAFLEDIEHIRVVTSREVQSRAEIRYLSGLLRRLLIDNNGDLRRIASPRIGRVNILCPDNKPFYSLSTSKTIEAFVSGGAPIFGVELRCGTLNRDKKPLPIPANFSPHERIALDIDGFLNHKIIFFKGTWFTRRDLVKFVANKASGVHFDGERTEDEKKLHEYRSAFRIVRQQNGPILENRVAYAGFEAPLEIEGDSVDGVLFELFTAAYLLSISPDIVELEKEIRKEFSRKS